jgi:hypothetical protein
MEKIMKMTKIKKRYAQALTQKQMTMVCGGWAMWSKNDQTWRGELNDGSPVSVEISEYLK